MAGWSREALIALITLLITCIPTAALLWGIHLRHKAYKALRRLPDTGIGHHPPNRPLRTRWEYLVRRDSEICAMRVVPGDDNIGGRAMDVDMDVFMLV